MNATIADSRAYEKVFVDIAYGSEGWAVVSQDTPRLKLEIFPKLSGEPWVFDLDEAIDILEKARKALRGSDDV